MKTEDKIQLMKLIYSIQNMGVNNTMIKSYFDPTGELRLHNPKNWLRFIAEHINLIDESVGRKPEIKVKKHEYLTK
jgi:hypothetical protein